MSAINENINKVIAVTASQQASDIEQYIQKLALESGK